MEGLAKENLSVAPWLVPVAQGFEEYRRWVNQSAYPVLANGPLAADSRVQALPEEMVALQNRLREQRRIPIVIVGETGVGKSTLLNALLETEVLPTGVIGSQTAAFVTIRYRSSWQVTCRYISEAELERLYADVAEAADPESESGSGELADRAAKKLHALLELDEESRLPSVQELRRGPSEELRSIVRLRERTFHDAKTCEEQLALHGQGRLWPLTREIDVAGPFRMLETGVVISDLPGAGDINRARVEQSAKSIQEAGQILVAADNKGLKESLLDQLKRNRLPHRLLAEEEPVSIVLLGTKLDSSLPDPEDQPAEVRKLGLDPEDPDTTPRQIFGAICEQWTRLIRGHFRSWLRTCAGEILPDVAAELREERIERILANTVVLPTCGRDAGRIRKGRVGKLCRTLEETGTPQLQEVIRGLAGAQIEATRREMESQIHQLRRSVSDALERSEALLGADIEEIQRAVERSQDQIQEVQDRYAAQIEEMRLSILNRFHLIRERLLLRIEVAAGRMSRAGEDRLRQHISEPGSLHWRSLRATVQSGGFWETGGGRIVNLRDAMGGELTGMVPQEWRSVADEALKKEIEETQQQLLAELDRYCTEVLGIVDAECTDPLSKRAVQRLFEGSMASATAAVDKAARAVTELRTQTAEQMQQRVDAAVDESLDAICDACSEDAGRGWNDRSRSRLLSGTRQVADRAQVLCQELAGDALLQIQKKVLEFCLKAGKQMERISSDLPTVVDEAVRKNRLTGPEELRRRLQEVRASEPVESAAGVEVLVGSPTGFGHDAAPLPVVAA